MNFASQLSKITGDMSILSLDFNPRSLIVDSSLSHPVILDEPSARLDAIFVPVRGRPQYVCELLRNLPETSTPIFLLPTSPSDLALVDVERQGPVETLLMNDPEFMTALNSLQCTSNDLSISYFGEWDLPAKRNYALWYASKHNFNRILLLDDDVRGFQSEWLTSGLNSLRRFAISGFFVDNFPDTSAIGHVKIGLGKPTWTFLSGSCLFIRVDCNIGFFPPIYNEDWLFMLPHIIRKDVCSLGCIHQKAYDPFATPSVALFQENGEIIADSLFALAASNCYRERLNPEFWRKLLALRRVSLTELVSRTTDGRRRAIVNSALMKCAEVTELDCVRFVNSWEADSVFWNHILQQLRGYP